MGTMESTPRPGNGRRILTAGRGPSDRALRLFACGCCRQWWDELAPPCRAAVEIAERYADGACDVAYLDDAYRACRQAEERGLRDYPRVRTTSVVHRIAAAKFTIDAARAVAADLRPWRGDCIDNGEVDATCARVRDDVFGQPRRPLRVSHRGLLPHTLELAHHVYESRDFGLMPELAFALLVAGCADNDLLAHCRAAGPHVRGCWALDCVLGKR